jgi:hypothetical protein
MNGAFRPNVTDRAELKIGARVLATGGAVKIWTFTYASGRESLAENGIPRRW